MLSIEDTALAVADTGGPSCPIVYLNGSYASRKDWRPVMAELGSEWRHVTYDERARGQSRPSADYSFESCLRDLDAVLNARKISRPLLVGWSYGAVLAVHWADRYPDRVTGVVSVDGAVPYGLTGEASRERIRKLFRQIGWLLPLASRLGLAARMSALQHADINIEINEIQAAIGPVLDRIRCPVRYVIGMGAHRGASEAEMALVRASLDPVLARNPHLVISANVSSNHENILRRDYRAVAAAIREVAALRF